MTWVAVAIGGSAVVGGLVSSHSASQASRAQENASNQANETQRYMFDQQRADQAPYRQVGTGALNALGGMYGIGPNGEKIAPDFSSFAQTPDYKFAFDQGISALDKSAAARGRLNSGGQMKGITRFGQGLATQNFNNYANRLASLAGIGQSANAQGAAAGQNYANQVGNNLQNAGNARASGYINNANSFNNVLSQGANAFGMYRGGMYGGGEGSIGMGGGDSYNLTPTG